MVKCSLTFWFLFFPNFWVMRDFFFTKNKVRWNTFTEKIENISSTSLNLFFNVSCKINFFFLFYYQTGPFEWELLLQKRICSAHSKNECLLLLFDLSRKVFNQNYQIKYNSSLKYLKATLRALFFILYYLILIQ